MAQTIDDIANVWTGPEGLRLQQKALAASWDDPALDVYNDVDGQTPTTA